MHIWKTDSRPRNKTERLTLTILGKFTVANDVWAFGILMWEVFSYGANPYAALPNQQVIGFVDEGGRLGMLDCLIIASIS